jgi:hypothetical protein
LAHWLYRETLWDYSLHTLIPYLQTFSPGIQSFFYSISYILDDGVFLAIFGFFAFFDRARGAYLLFSIGFIGCLCEYLKMMYSDGRPFWIGEDV